jgi:hypothetical protein
MYRKRSKSFKHVFNALNVAENAERRRTIWPFRKWPNITARFAVFPNASNALTNVRTVC